MEISFNEHDVDSLLVQCSPCYSSLWSPVLSRTFPLKQTKLHSYKRLFMVLLKAT